MRKISTRAAKQSRNISQQRLTIGLDLGDRNSWYCVVDEAGQIQLKQRVRTSAKALQEVFAAMPRSRIALEIGTHSPWISRLLSELGHEVIVANARKVRLIGESRKKDDRLDAQTLTRLARIDPELLYPVKHRSVQTQADLMMIRARAGLVRARTGLVNTARGLAKSYGERLRGCSLAAAQDAQEPYVRFFNDSAKAVNFYVDGQLSCTVPANPEGNLAHYDAEINER
jgi:transposase